MIVFNGCQKYFFTEKKNRAKKHTLFFRKDIDLPFMCDICCFTQQTHWLQLAALMNVCNYRQKQCQGTIKKMLPFVEWLIIHDLETVKCVITLSVAYVLPRLFLHNCYNYCNVSANMHGFVKGYYLSEYLIVSEYLIYINSGKYKWYI